MNILDQFIAWILLWVNKGIYVWGGQGETITSAMQIKRMETSTVNALRAIRLWIKRGRNAVCFDCSGLLVAKLLSMGIIQYDTTAHGLMCRCIVLKKSQLKRGDWVFRTRDGKAYHIGIVVEIKNGIPQIVESRGRDDGVVIHPIDYTDGYWTDYGRPGFFAAYIESHSNPYTEPSADHEYKKEFRGNDAGWFETELHRIGYDWDRLGCDGGPDEIAGDKVWEMLEYEMKQSGKPVGAAGKDIRDYLKSCPSKE